MLCSHFWLFDLPVCSLDKKGRSPWMMGAGRGTFPVHTSQNLCPKTQKQKNYRTGITCCWGVAPIFTTKNLSLLDPTFKRYAHLQGKAGAPTFNFLFFLKKWCRNTNIRLEREGVPQNSKTPKTVSWVRGVCPCACALFAWGR